MTEITAIIATVLLALLTLFQLALIAGAPLGRMAWGGQHRVLPTKLRISSAVSISLYVLFALIILSYARVINIFHGEWLSVAIWILAGYFTLGIVMNLVSRSKPERLVMTPIAAILAVLFLYVAAS